MPRYVITLAGEDRSGLVSAVADAVSAHGGNWEGSQLAERAGVFAGVVEISVADESAQTLLDALRALDETLTVTALSGVGASAADRQVSSLVISLVANDRPGIVRDVSAVLAAHELSIDDLSTEVLRGIRSGAYGGRDRPFPGQGRPREAGGRTPGRDRHRLTRAVTPARLGAGHW